MRLLALVTLSLLAAAAPAAADSFSVDRLDDANVSACTPAPNDCSLRGATTAVDQAGTSENTITLPPGRIVLGAPLPGLSRTLAIHGAGARATTIDAAGTTDQVLTTAGSLDLADLTVTGAKDAGGIGVGAVNGAVDLQRVAIVDNQTIGLVEQNGTVDDSLIARNVGSQGGGIAANGIVIRNSTIADNIARSGTGAPPVALAAGVFTQGFAVIDHSTIARNHLADGTFSLLGVSLSSISPAEVPMVVRSSIVDGPWPNCGGRVVSQRNNVSSDQSCGFTEAGDRADVDPRLGPLADNGGPTDTIALLEGSPAIDGGGDCPAVDQRGASRAQGTTCDVGAFESPFTAPAPVAVPPPATPPAPPPPVDPPPPADRTSPTLTLARVKKTVTRRALRKGLTIAVGVNEPAVADVTLLVASSRSAKQPTLELTSATLAVGRGTRTVKLKSSQRIAGTRRVRARIRVVAYDLAGNRSVRQVDFTIA